MGIELEIGGDILSRFHAVIEREEEAELEDAEPQGEAKVEDGRVHAESVDAEAADVGGAKAATAGRSDGLGLVLEEGSGDGLWRERWMTGWARRRRAERRGAEGGARRRDGCGGGGRSGGRRAEGGARRIKTDWRATKGRRAADAGLSGRLTREKKHDEVLVLVSFFFMSRDMLLRIRVEYVHRLKYSWNKNRNSWFRI
jgi:hypothetical protein